MFMFIFILDHFSLTMKCEMLTKWGWEHLSANHQKKKGKHSELMRNYGRYGYGPPLLIQVGISWRLCPKGSQRGDVGPVFPRRICGSRRRCFRWTPFIARSVHRKMLSDWVFLSQHFGNIAGDLVMFLDCDLSVSRVNNEKKDEKDDKILMNQTNTVLETKNSPEKPLRISDLGFSAAWVNWFNSGCILINLQIQMRLSDEFSMEFSSEKLPWWSRWWFQIFVFSPLPGEMIQFD